MEDMTQDEWEKLQETIKKVEKQERELIDSMIFKEWVELGEKYAKLRDK